MMENPKLSPILTELSNLVQKYTGSLRESEMKLGLYVESQKKLDNYSDITTDEVEVFNNDLENLMTALVITYDIKKNIEELVNYNQSEEFKNECSGLFMKLNIVSDNFRNSTKAWFEKNQTPIEEILFKTN